MTIEKAIEYWKSRYENTKYFDDVHCDADELREHEEYVEVLKETITALEKQVPKKPLYRETEYYAHKFAKGIKAPFCECSRLAVDEENDCFTYCPDCGQALDWSDENE